MKYTVENARKAAVATLRSCYGVPIKRETIAVREDGEVRRVQFGDADTFFSAPAAFLLPKNVRQYGFITHDDDLGYYKFIAMDDQAEAKKNFHQSTRC